MENKTKRNRREGISTEVFIKFCIAFGFLFIAALMYCYALTGELQTVNGNVLTLKSQMDVFAKQNEQLTAEKEVLQEEVFALNKTMDEKIRQEEEREAELAKSYLPTGFPIKGRASYDEQENILDGNPAVIFHTVSGTSVTAAANGTVSCIEEREAMGYLVMIDHDNGYFSVYRNGAKPKVREGDVVTDTTELFSIEEGYEDLGYQIIENESYINPLDFMEIHG